MSGRQLVVIEANEIPPRLFRWYADLEPSSTIASLVQGDRLIETELFEDLDGRELYPSQSWASVGMAVPHSTHGIYWYSDPKPATHPFYWQRAAAAGKRVGVVGTLHSSPLSNQPNLDNFAFCIPDCFATDAATIPPRYERFQELNLKLTRDSGRVVRARVQPRDMLTLASTLRLGVRPASVLTLARLGAQVAAKRVSRERIRSAQFVVLADMFEHLVRTTDPDLAVLFTNHVAAAMHRYWYALFPEDFATALYDDKWVQRYRDEIPAAMALLDAELTRMVRLCDATGRGLVLMTSMGQVATPALRGEGNETAIVRHPTRFLNALEVTGHSEVRAGMVPQVGLVFASEREAGLAAHLLRTRETTGLRLEVDQAGSNLTLTYFIDAAARSVTVGSQRFEFDELGVEVERIDDHRSGDHDPIGTLLTHGIDLEFSSRNQRVDALNVAPAVLQAVGVPWSQSVDTTEMAWPTGAHA